MTAEERFEHGIIDKDVTLIRSALDHGYRLPTKLGERLGIIRALTLTESIPILQAVAEVKHPLVQAAHGRVGYPNLWMSMFVGSLTTVPQVTLTFFRKMLQATHLADDELKLGAYITIGRLYDLAKVIIDYQSSELLDVLLTVFPELIQRRTEQPSGMEPGRLDLLDLAVKANLALVKLLAEKYGYDPAVPGRVQVTYNSDINIVSYILQRGGDPEELGTIATHRFVYGASTARAASGPYDDLPLRRVSWRVYRLNRKLWPQLKSFDHQQYLRTVTVIENALEDALGGYLARDMQQFL